MSALGEQLPILGILPARPSWVSRARRYHVGTGTFGKPKSLGAVAGCASCQLDRERRGTLHRDLIDVQGLLYCPGAHADNATVSAQLAHDRANVRRR